MEKQEHHNTRGSWERYADVVNDESEKEAVSKFKKTPEAHCLDNADAIFDVIADAIKDVRASKAPYKISNFVSNELKRALSTKTWTECVKYEIDERLSDDKFATKVRGDVLMSYIDDVWTDTYGIWRQVVVALAAFLREAAAFAKKSGSIDSARKFILAWGKLNRLNMDVFVCMSQGEASAVVDSIAEAEDILWADLELAEL